MARTTTVGWLFGALLSAAILSAQGGPTTLQFSFSNPGARSLGLGGAFVALADDATAAFANPAGLVQLTRPEVSIEGRYWSYSTPFTAGGRISGQPTGIGLDTPLRTSESEFDTTEARLDDADELHLGVEYVFLKISPIVALRAGLWKDPDHQIRSEEDDPLERALLPGGNDEVHFSVGAGVAFKNLQWDLVDTASLSLIWAF